MTYEECLKFTNDIIRFIKYFDNIELMKQFSSYNSNETKLHISISKNRIRSVDYNYYEVLRTLNFSPSIVLSDRNLWYSPDSCNDTLYHEYYDFSTELSEEMYFQLSCTLDDDNIILGIMIYSHLFKLKIPYNFNIDFGYFYDALKILDDKMEELNDR